MSVLSAKNKTILITGATGFLGSHLVNKLVNENSYRIIVLKRTFSNLYRINHLIHSDKIKFYNVDEISLEKIFDENAIDCIIHCATEYGRTINSLNKVIQTNLEFSIRLLELAKEHNTEVFINTDSYFNKNGLSYPYLLNYSLSKKSFELWLKQYSKNIKIANLMLEHVYGDNDNADKFIETMISKIAIEKIDAIDLSLGTQKRDFIYVDDVCEIYIKVIKEMFAMKNCEYRNIEIGTGHSITIREFVETIKRIANSPTKLNFGVIPTRTNEILDSKANLEDKFKIDFKNIEEGINMIIKAKTLVAVERERERERERE